LRLILRKKSVSFCSSVFCHKQAHVPRATWHNYSAACVTVIIHVPRDTRRKRARTSRPDYALSQNTAASNFFFQLCGVMREREKGVNTARQAAVARRAIFLWRRATLICAPFCVCHSHAGRRQHISSRASRKKTAFDLTHIHSCDATKEQLPAACSISFHIDDN